MNGWDNTPRDYREYAGFIYLIHCKANNKTYIGRKFFWKTIKKAPLKGKTRKRLMRVESDWRSYWGSCEALLDDKERYGECMFTRRILNCYKSKSECIYYELKEQLSRDVLGIENVENRHKYYNKMIHIRIGGNGTRKLTAKHKEDMDDEEER